jgi:hypothetical protein
MRGRAVDGAVALIADVHWSGESIPALRYKPSVSGGERAAPIDASLCGGK